MTAGPERGVLAHSAGFRFSKSPPDWARPLWVRVLKPIRAGDEDAVASALKAIYGDVPDEEVREMARGYLQAAEELKEAGKW